MTWGRCSLCGDWHRPDSFCLPKIAAEGRGLGPAPQRDVDRIADLVAKLAGHAKASSSHQLETAKVVREITERLTKAEDVLVHTFRRLEDAEERVAKLARRVKRLAAGGDRKG